LFGDHVAERRVNETSFAVLQQFLDDYQIFGLEGDGENAPPTDPRSVDLTFYVRNRQENGEGDAKLDRVNVALQTPARSRGIPREIT
jgi:hypothetical protein